ncbi:hypothetical protein ACHQM5_019558 [Ranunculus cassubicifolius]
MLNTSLAKFVLHKTNLFSYLDIYPSLIRIRFISIDSTAHHNSFTISYLINTCGLSQQKALSISKKIHFESPTKPDSVLTLLKNNGFSDSQISKIIAMYPTLLISKVDKTLKPKFDFFNSKGLSGADLAKVLCQNPNVLGSSLEKTIIPSFNLLESIVGTHEKVLAMLNRSMNVLSRIKTVESNIALLRSHGVPMSNLQKLLVSQPRALLRNPSRFSEDVEEVMKMKFDPSRQVFLAAIQVLSAMSRSSLDAKFCLYKSWGWSEDQVQCAFRKQPFCMSLSEENIKSTMDYFVNKLGYAPSSIAEQPSVLLYSCEKRIIPRCSAMQILIKNGKVAQSIALGSLLQMPEDVFLEKYISRFEKEVPELLRAYKGEGKRNG